MKKFILSALTLSLFACGGGGGNSGSPNNTTTTTPPETISSSSSSSKPVNVITTTSDKIEIKGSNVTKTVNSQTKIAINIIGNNNDIYIETNISSLDISGDNNDIFISDGVAIDSCTVQGKNNTNNNAKIPLNCSNVIGSNNHGF